MAKRKTYTLKIEGGGDGDSDAVRELVDKDLAADFTSSSKTKRR